MPGRGDDSHFKFAFSLLRNLGRIAIRVQSPSAEKKQKTKGTDFLPYYVPFRIYLGQLIVHPSKPKPSQLASNINERREEGDEQTWLCLG